MMDHVHRNRKITNTCMLVMVTFYVIAIVIIMFIPKNSNYESCILREEVRNIYKSNEPDIIINNTKLYNTKVVWDFVLTEVLRESEESIKHSEFYQPNQPYDIIFIEKTIQKTKGNETQELQGTHSEGIITVLYPQHGSIIETIAHEQTHYLMHKFAKDKEKSILNEGYCDYIGRKEYDIENSELQELLSRPDAGTILLDFSKLDYTTRRLTVSLLKRFTDLSDSELLSLDAQEIDSYIDSIKEVVKRDYNKNIEVRNLI